MTSNRLPLSNKDFITLYCLSPPERHVRHRLSGGQGLESCKDLSLLYRHALYNPCGIAHSKLLLSVLTLR